MECIVFRNPLYRSKTLLFRKNRRRENVFFTRGAVADVFWREIKNHAKNIDLGSYVIMPNHVHGIITSNNDIKPVFVETRRLVPTKTTKTTGK